MLGNLTHVPVPCVVNDFVYNFPILKFAKGSKREYDTSLVIHVKSPFFFGFIYTIRRLRENTQSVLTSIESMYFKYLFGMQNFFV